MSNIRTNVATIEEARQSLMAIARQLDALGANRFAPAYGEMNAAITTDALTFPAVADAVVCPAAMVATVAVGVTLDVTAKRMQIDTAGDYAVGVEGAAYYASDPMNTFIGIRKNGTTAMGWAYLPQYTATLGTASSGSIQKILTLAVGDYLEPVVAADASMTQKLAFLRISAIRIG